MKGLTLTTKEQSRIQALNGVLDREVTVAEAGGGCSTPTGRNLQSLQRLAEGPVRPATPAGRLIVATALCGHQLVTADRRIPDWPGQLDRLDATD